MKRRTFIIAAIATSGAVAVSAVAFICRKQGHYNPLSTPDILSSFCDKDTISAIGTRYLRDVPAEAQEQKLHDLILTDQAGKKLTSSDNIAVSNWVNEQARQDFMSNRILTINGWVISLTEARQCALLSFNK
jgi:hypothetical protein